MIKIIGISAFFHDSAASLIIDGEIISAISEERFTRIKNDANFPINSIKFILEENNLNINEIDYVVFYDKPLIKFERLIETYIDNAPRGFKSFQKAMPIWLNEKLFQKKIIYNEIRKISKNFKESKLLFSEHHLSHAASAYYPSPYKDAVILTLDGVGEWSTTSVFYAKDNKIEAIKEINFPHSIGLLYSAFTYYLGFKVNSGEYKVMGLAPYGKPIYKDKILNDLIDLKDDGSFRLNQNYFNYSTGLKMTNNKFDNLFNNKRRLPEKDNLTQFHMDIAASIQAALEEIILKIVKSISKEFTSKNLCMAGGVALNCVANSKVLNSNYFKNIWIQPASGDAGGSLGAALTVWHMHLDNPKINTKDSMKGSYLGPEFSEKKIEESLNTVGAKFSILDEKKLIEDTAKALSENKIIGWFQGKMEFGPRSLGNRSIIANPLSLDMQKKLNLKIKYRESFRPFAPAVLRDRIHEWFDMNIDSPYMLFVANILDKIKINNEDKNLFGIDRLNLIRSKIPAITHVDYSARIQTVHKETNKLFYQLIEQFDKITNTPILVNTSFNIRGEPIVCSPEDAFKCFMGTELDCLVIGNFFLEKDNQTVQKNNNYKNNYKLD